MTIEIRAGMQIIKQARYKTLGMGRDCGKLG